MVETEIVRVIGKLNSFLFEKKNRINGGIREVVETVRNELRLILDFVKDKKLEEGSSLKYLMSDVAEIANDALLITHGKTLSMFIKFEPIRTALSETRNRILQLRVERANQSPTTSSYPQEGGEKNVVVGLEEDMESVLSEMIRRQGRDLHTMCVVGMAGVGKTTLARIVYDHAAVVDRYELRAWVSFSGELSNKEVLMKLLLQLLHKKDQSLLLEEMENEGLQQMLHQHLQGKPFLVVFDNMEKMPYFSSIFKALPKEEKQSRLLLTSRFQSIKYRVESFARVSSFQMKPLDGDRSWQLFLKLLIFGNQKLPKQLETKGKEMLRRCDGLPLSIKEVATQFIMKRQNGVEWEELLESIDLSGTLAILESIYQRWPPQLKSCFLCLSFFKKGTLIRVEKLVQVWTAAQVVPQEKGEEDDRDSEEEENPNFDILEGYKTTLMKLIDESIIEVDRSKHKRIKFIRINASFHALSMAKAKEEMVFETLKKGEGNPPSSQEPHHRAIYCIRDEYNLFMHNDEHLVSLFFRGGGYFDASESYWKRFEKLKTLDFEDFGLKMLLETIGSLKELRYLGLRNNYIQELPQSLGFLENLEVLDIELNFLVEVPDILWKFDNLRHLYMSGIICQKPLHLNTLEKLETLTYISVDNWAYEAWDLTMGSTLRKLGIEEVHESSNLSKLSASLSNLWSLDCLILRGFHFRSMPSLEWLETLDCLTEIRLDGLITELPRAYEFPRRISHLSLINSRLDEDPMPELGKLDLAYLKLKNAYTGQQMVIPSQSFLNLEVLCVEELWHLRNIQVENTLELVKLEIKSCPYMENIPKNLITYRMKELKVLTTRRLATKIWKSDFISEIKHVDIQP